jgi:hypothetical protein
VECWELKKWVLKEKTIGDGLRSDLKTLAKKSKIEINCKFEIEMIHF